MLVSIRENTCIGEVAKPRRSQGVSFSSIAACRAAYGHRWAVMAFSHLWAACISWHLGISCNDCISRHRTQTTDIYMSKFIVHAK
jgi:hypothetical protein